MRFDDGIVAPQWPMFDEEYFEWSSALGAAISAVENRRGLMMAEIGAGEYAIWAVRTAVAFNRIAPADAECHLLLLEPYREESLGIDGIAHGELLSHMTRNLPPGRCQITIERG